MNRRSFVEITLGAAAAAACAPPLLRRGPSSAAASSRPHPSKSQLEWQRDELALFFHFGVNTFTDREWGDGTEDPKIFNPTNLDARQWARTAKAAGAKAMILTAKHHDGFCLWPTATTRHSVVSSPFRGGRGDVVREFVDACRAEGLKPGLYLSPWDRNSPVYGDSPRYNDLYCDQLTELLTRYGKIHEVWFDGANGEGPNGRRQQYDWPRTFGLVRKLQPEAVMFSDVGPDVRWCGNERGVAGDPNWSTFDPEAIPFPGSTIAGAQRMLQNGHANGTVWRPAEVDVSIRPGWFHHPAEDARVRSVDNLVELYFSSIGRNGKLLLNVPPTRDGLVHPIDIARLTGFRQRISSLVDDNAGIAERAWQTGSNGIASIAIAFGGTRPVSCVRLQENITRGQAVSSYTLYDATGDGTRVLSRGTTIGYTKLDRFAPTSVSRLRLTIEALTDTGEITLTIYSPA